MNLAGWVPIPRSIMYYTHTGRLSNTEQLVFLTLILTADHKKGCGRTNAAAIRFFLPGLKYDTAKCVMKSLEEKRLIFRQIKHASTDLYPYWLHGYQISDGPNKFRWTNLSEVFVKRDISAIRYDEDAPEPLLETPLEITPATAPEAPPPITPGDPPKYDTNKDKHKDKDKDKYDPLGSAECLSSSLINATHSTPDVRTKCSIGFPARAEVVPKKVPNQVPDVRCVGSQQSSGTVRRANVGLQWIKGLKVWRDAVTGEIVPPLEVRERVGRVNLELFGEEFYDSISKEPVPWDVALRRIAA